MPQRHKAHQLESISKVDFQKCLPASWVVRWKTDDYGIDGEIEIFDETGKDTGLIFLVQLKATSSSRKKEVQKLIMKVETIKYYQKLDLPVMIVKYNKKEEFFYFKWAHKVDTYAKKKYITIHFDEEKLTDEEIKKTPDYLIMLRNLKTNITLPVSVALIEKEDNIWGVPLGSFMPEFRMQLENYSDLLIYEKHSEKAFLNVYFDKKSLVVSLLHVHHVSLDNIKIDDIKNIERFSNHLLLGFALTLAQVGNFECVARILLHQNLKNKDSEYIHIQILSNCMLELLSTSRCNEIVDKICQLLDVVNDEVFEIFTIGVMALSSLDAEKIEHVFKKLIDKYTKLNNKSQVGCLYYNLGNLNARKYNYRQACFYFFNAKKYEKEYLNRAYFYEEIASSLFLLGKYNFAAKNYKMAIDKGASKKTLPKYADALMCSGHYQMAYDIFSDYFNSACINDTSNAEWFLKKITLGKVIAITRIKEQSRQPKKAKNMAYAKSPQESFSAEKFKSAITLDALCCIAWFNNGIFESKEKNFETATFSFLLCALIENGDIEAWVNATISAFNIDNILFFRILTLAHAFHQDKFHIALNKELTSQCGNGEMPKFIFHVFINSINDFLSKNELNYTKNSEKPIIRFF